MKKRGRVKGSTSFMQIELEELNRLLKPNAKVIVSAKYASLIGLNGKPVAADSNTYDHCVKSNVEINLETFGSEAPEPVKNKNTKNSDQEHIPLDISIENWE